jgi:predicted nucleic acid-binding protein
MITAIDTSVLLDILLPNPDFCDGSMQTLEAAAVAGSLVICDLVYAEVCVCTLQPKMTATIFSTRTKSGSKR